MSLINQDIKNLVSGISQQPPILRYPEQLEEQVNGFSSEANGLQKRPPSTFISKLRESKDDNRILCHFVNRDEFEKYIVIFTGQGIEVFDLQGNKKTVNFKTEDAKRYVWSEQPRYRLKALTIADYTFVTNTEQKVRAVEAPLTNKWQSQGLLVNIKSGQYGRTYKIEVNGQEIASYQTPDGSDKSHANQIATDYIANQLAIQCTGKGYQVQLGSSWLYVNKTETTTEAGDVIQVGPSTTPKQQVDRFKGISTHYIPLLPFSELSLPISASYNAEGTITLKGITKEIDGYNPPPGKYSQYHFQPNSPELKEVERCRGDKWSVTEQDINEPLTGNYSKWCHYTKKYTLVPQYSEKIPEGAVTRTIIKTAKVYDGFNNQAAFGIMRTVQKFTHLPSSAPDGFTVKILGEDGSATDDYYVSYDAKDNVWKETVQPGLVNEFKNETMPHVLVREADGTFTFRAAEWEARTIGDDDSNPMPSFIDNTISDIFYHRNRLGFLSGENVILTRSADFFNFWIASATTLQDTDPIDLAVADNSISPLYHAVPFDASLILFSDDAQFALETANVLTPKDAYLTPPLTHFGASLKAKPVNAGRNIYFVAERSKYTTVREYFTAADNTESKDAQDITSHCPSYIPNGVYKIIPSSVENLLLFLTEGEPNSIYVYKYLFIDGARQQASWSKWSFSSTIYGGAFLDGAFYIVVKRNNILCLEKIVFTFNTTDFTEEPYRVLLDSKIKTVVSPDSYNDELTSINIKDILGPLYSKDIEYSIVFQDGKYRTDTDKDGLLTVIGDYSNQYIFIGINYNFKIVLSPLLVKVDRGQGLKALDEGRLQLRQGWFNYADSGYFKVKVNDYVYENTQRILGTPESQLNTMPFTTNIFKFPIQAEAHQCRISVESDAPLPLSLVGAGWIGNYVRRTRLF